MTRQDNHPTISVVTVTFENLPGLQRTTESLRVQEPSAVEHIVIDGGSTDGSADWIRANPAVANTTVVSEPDQGIYDAMNKGLALASGDLITFLNAGDAYAHDGVLAAVARDFQKHHWQWGYGWARVIDQFGHGVRPVQRTAYAWWRLRLGLLQICHQAVFMRADLLRSYGGFNQKEWGGTADVAIVLRTARDHHPRTWQRLDVLYLAGGISEQGLYRALWRMHRMRTQILQLSYPGRAVDAGWTLVLEARMAMRRSGKRVVRALGLTPVLRWWGAKGAQQTR